MTGSERGPERIEGRVAFTLGAGRLGRNRLVEVLTALQIKHRVDVRDSIVQSKRGALKPSDLASATSALGVEYHDASETLGDRQDYRMFALSDEFARSADGIARLLQDGNLLLFCAEPDYRRCHRRYIASYLSTHHGVPVRHLRKNLPVNFQSTLEASLSQRPSVRRMLTIGFAGKNMREFLDLLRAARIRRLVDIRLRPTSQYAGFARRDDLEYLMNLLQIEYVHMPELAPTAPLLDGYRDDNDWKRYQDEFRKLLNERKPDELLSRLLTPGTNVAFLCTEDMPQQCHRRLVAEYAKRIFPDIKVIHLTSRGQFEEGLQADLRELVKAASQQ